MAPAQDRAPVIRREAPQPCMELQREGRVERAVRSSERGVKCEMLTSEVLRERGESESSGGFEQCCGRTRSRSRADRATRSSKLCPASSPLTSPSRPRQSSSQEGGHREERWGWRYESSDARDSSCKESAESFDTGGQTEGLVVAVRQRGHHA